VTGVLAQEKELKCVNFRDVSVSCSPSSPLEEEGSRAAQKEGASSTKAEAGVSMQLPLVPRLWAPADLPGPRGGQR
jgi:hypothetical protein